MINIFSRLSESVRKRMMRERVIRLKEEIDNDVCISDDKNGNVAIIVKGVPVLVVSGTTDINNNTVSISDAKAVMQRTKDMLWRKLNNQPIV